MILRFLLCWLSTAVLFCATPLDIHERFNFDTGTNWQPVSTTELANTSQGSLISGWSLNDAAVTNTHFFVTNWQPRLARPYSIPGTITNALDTNTHSMAIILEASVAERYVQSALGAARTQLTGVFFYQNNFASADENFYDLIKFQNGGSDAVIQYVNSGTDRWQAHTGSPSAEGTDDVNVTASQTNLCIAWKFDSTPGTTNFTFRLYDLNTRDFIGQASLALGGSYPPIQNIRLGNGSRGSPPTQRTNYVNNFLISTNIALYPMVPWDTNVFYVNGAIGSDSNSGRANTAAAAWATITKAEATLTAGQTAYVMDGTYSEAVTFDADGTAGNLRSFIANSTNVLARNFIVTGDYTRIKGFYFTALGANTNVTPVVVADATGVELIDNRFVATGHGTSGGEGGGIRFGNATNLLVRGQTFTYAGTNGDTASPTTAKDIADGPTAGTNSLACLFEYNVHSHASEYMNPSGRRMLFRNIRFGPTDGNDWGGTPHTDGIQVNGFMSYWFLEDSWHGSNVTADAHFTLNQYGRSFFGTVARNVIWKSGDVQTIWLGDPTAGPVTTNHYIAHNAIAETAVGPGRAITQGRPIYFANSSNNWSFNNALSNVTTAATPYQLGTDGVTPVSGGDFMYPQGTGSSVLNIADPGWVSYPSDFRIASGSAMRDASVVTNLALTVGGGTGTTITVDRAKWFHDGMGMTRGSLIYVGADNNLLVTGVDWTDNTVTVSASFTWADSERVGYAYLGSGPDAGPYEYGAVLLSAATISDDGAPFPTHTVAPTGDARFVVFYTDGIPQAPDYDSPFTYTATGNEVVTAKVYALRAQDVMVFDAEASTPIVATGVIAAGAPIFSGGAIIR